MTAGGHEGGVRPRNIYLDYNATAPLLPSARAAMEQTLDELGNPSSAHRLGRRARERVETARETVARLARARTDEVIFTSGGTEANNLALSASLADGGEVWASAGEHSSVLGVLEASGANWRALALTADGEICTDALSECLSRAERPPVLLSVQAANNETGVLQPLEPVLELSRRYSVPLHVDAAQYLGRIAASNALAEAEMVTLSAHKFGGPQGAGALVARDASLLSPVLRGGGQENSRRAGTENVLAIAGFGAAAESVTDSDSFLRLEPLRERLEHDLRASATEAGVELRIAGAGVARLSNTSCFALAGGRADMHLAALDMEGVALSSGSACSSGKIEPSHVLLAMGWSRDDARGALRLSMGWATTSASLSRFVELWERLCLGPVARRRGARVAAAAH
ncbi:MAG: cysteine desulfurase [Alphaproteobacteria bacterium]|nr:cysteine desulfurase [Alphaproteobacteria bacterium]